MSLEPTKKNLMKSHSKVAHYSIKFKSDKRPLSKTKKKKLGSNSIYVNNIYSNLNIHIIYIFNGTKSFNGIIITKRNYYDEQKSLYWKKYLY